MAAIRAISGAYDTADGGTYQPRRRGKQRRVAGTPAVEAEPKRRRTATPSTDGVFDGRSGQRRPDPPAGLGSPGWTSAARRLQGFDRCRNVLHTGGQR